MIRFKTRERPMRKHSKSKPLVKYRAKRNKANKTASKSRMRNR